MIFSVAILATKNGYQESALSEAERTELSWNAWSSREVGYYMTKSSAGNQAWREGCYRDC